MTDIWYHFLNIAQKNVDSEGGVFFISDQGIGTKNGSGSWIRTSDQVVNSHLLYR